MQPLSDVEVTLRAGEVQWCIALGVGGVERGARAVQPLSDVEVTLETGEVQWLHTIRTRRTHACAARHRRLRCRQVARVHSFDQPRVCVVACARACGGGRRMSTRCLHTCNWGGVASDSHAYGAVVQSSGPCARRTRQAIVLRSACWSTR